MLKQTSNSNSAIFTNPIKDFKVYTPSNDPQLPSTIGVLGPQKTEFLNGLAMKYIPAPPLSRKYPLLAETNNYDQIGYLNFKESSGLDKVHLSARYESYSYKGSLEMSDDVNSVRNYITGNNNYNKNTNDPNNQIDAETVDRIIDMFNLGHLTKKWINSLSNGQLRRARIAKAILHKPKLLIIDDPFLGLDPVQTNLVSDSLEKMSSAFDMSIILGLRFQDKVPEWITHVAEVHQEGLKVSGHKAEVLPLVSQELGHQPVLQDRELKLSEIKSSDDICPKPQTPHIEFQNASVVYKDVPVLTNFNWKIPKGSNWRILGENGTGKTTIVSLITADHPQSWRSVLSMNGKLRKTGSGITFFDVNNNLGISSPELHALVPGHKTMGQIIKTGLVKDTGNSNFMFSGDNLQFPNEKIDQLIMQKEFGEILQTWAEVPFMNLSITLQKLTLFLRAIAKDPELIILDEAFSCMDDITLMKQCHKVVDQYFQDSTILAIGHLEWELPEYNYVLHLLGDQSRNYKLYKLVR